MGKSLPSVLIFRKRILPYSETFIAAQGHFLASYTPCYVGFQHNDSGKPLLENSETIVLCDYSRAIGWAKLKYRLGFCPNKAWLDALKNLKPALIHAHFAKDAIDALRLSEWLDIPLIATIHGHDITQNKVSTGYEKKRRRMFQRAGKIIAVSQFIKERLIKSGCPEEKIVQHYIGIDIEKFTGVKVESESPSVLFVGRLAEKKGCCYLLDAMARLKPAFPDLALNIVGTGPLENNLRQKAADLELNANFLGSRSPQEVKKLMLTSWIFCTPSITAANGDAEGLGMVFLEAQALQTPVVSFDSGGVGEAVENGVTGLLSEEKDVTALADNIAFFLKNREARLEYGEKGRLRVVEQFNIAEQCKKLEQIYQSVTS
ncbi:MAG: glycosyltransferase [Gammaproteobacteria bacterium]|jgi:glycosyltransferase involved in cell wall biosynthesis